MNNAKSYDLLLLLKRFIKASETGKRKQSNGKKITKGTIQNYYFLLQQLEQFTITEATELRLPELKRSGKRQVKANYKYWQQFYVRFTAFLYKKKLSDNYVGMLIKILRCFFNYLETEKQIYTGNSQKKFIVPKEEIPIVVISPSQLQELIHTEEDRLSDKGLLLIKDIFVFGCTVALRVSDLLTLNAYNIEDRGEGKIYLVVQSKKTNTLTRVKLPAYCIDIINRYRHHKRKTIFPLISNGHLNRKLKILFEQLGYTAPYMKYRLQQGSPVAVYKNAALKTPYRFCDMITSHTMRRTAITTMLCLGMPEYMVRQISGHAANSREFYRYVALSQQFMDEAINKVHAQLA